MCYEKRPKYLGAFTPAYKTYIMYFIKLLKLLLLSSPCHRESSTDKKVSEKRSLSGATDATRSNGDPARTEVTSPGFWHLSARRMPGWAAGALPTPLTHTWVSTAWGSPGTTPAAWRTPLGTTRSITNPALSAARSQRRGLREERGTVTRKGPRKSTWEGQGQGKSLTRRLLGVQRRQQHHQAFSTTPLFWFVPFLTQFILQAWLSPI